MMSKQTHLSMRSSDISTRRVFTMKHLGSCRLLAGPTFCIHLEVHIRLSNCWASRAELPRKFGQSATRRTARAIA